jgi:hypothetical protein
MSRVLNRPMFRLGGSTSGITSGLNKPKRGGSMYQEVMLVSIMIKPGNASQRITDKYYPRRGGNINRFLIDWGLNMVGNPPTGNVLQTAAKQAQQPTKELFASMDQSDAMRSAVGADIFGKILAAEGEMMGGEGGAKWQKQWEVNTIKNAYNGIIDNNIRLDELRKDPEGNKAQILELEKENREYKVDIAHLQKQDPLVKSISSNKEIIGNIYNSTLEKLEDITEDIVVTEDNKAEFPNNEIGETVSRKVWDKDSPEIQAEAIRQIKIMFPPGGEIDLSFLEKKAEGGRVGLNLGGLPNQGSPTAMANAATDTEVEDAFGVSVADAAPQVDAVGMSFEELRARLPATITDEIVILLSQSAQALEDFATIQTQQDVDNFNTKYNVNLILPSEG